MTTLRLGTRGSPLALFQAHAVATLLRERSGVSTEIVVIKTSGDRLGEVTLSEVGGKRMFVKEIEDALLAREVDVAVHSSKDLPAQLPEGLELGAVLPREDPRDAIVLPRTSFLPADAGSHIEFRVRSNDGNIAMHSALQRLGATPRIGTSSVRRSAQLTRLIPDASFLPIRGNLDTRLLKLDSGEFDALVLAAAGLRRLERHERISATLPAEICVPAPGQGIIAVEIRSGDSPVSETVARIDDATTAAALQAERAVVVRLGGGCQMPLGAHAEISGNTVDVTAIVISVDGSRVAKAATRRTSARPESAGIEVAELLLQRGAGEILAEVQRAQIAAKR